MAVMHSCHTATSPSFSRRSPEVEVGRLHSERSVLHIIPLRWPVTSTHVKSQAVRQQTSNTSINKV